MRCGHSAKTLACVAPAAPEEAEGQEEAEGDSIERSASTHLLTCVAVCCPVVELESPSSVSMMHAA